MATKKFMSLERMQEYDALIKSEILEGDTAAKTYADGIGTSTLASAKSYTDEKVDAITSGSVTVAEAEHATTADSATTATNATNANHATSADTATSATSATKATQDASGNVITSTYETKSDASAKLTEAKTYTDTKTSGLASTTVVDNKISTHNTSSSAHSDIRDLITALSTKVNNFLDVDDTTTDELSEVLALINNNKGTLESLTSSKVNVSDIVDNLTTSNASKVLSAKQGVALKALIDALQEAVDGKAASSHSHTITASASDDDVVVLTGTNGTNKVTYSASHANSGVTAGTYKSVTVNAKGHVTAGSNPTTLSGFGITDAYTKTSIDSALEGKSDTGHTHTKSQITDFPTSLKNPNALTIQGNGTTLTNGTYDGSAAKTVNITPSSIGAAASSHTHSIANVTNLQSSLDAKVPTSRTINGKALSANITLSASDVNAYTKAEIDSYEFITIADIDTICGATIVAASEVQF